MSAIADLSPLLPKLAAGPPPMAQVPGIVRDPARLRMALDELRRDRTVETATSRLRDFLQRFQQDRSAQEGPELDDAIQSLLAEEMAAAGRHQDTIARADEMLAAAQEQKPSTVALVREMNALIVNRHADYLDAVRDLRVAAVARRAELEPPPEGAVLSTPAEVHAFFEKLRAG